MRGKLSSRRALAFHLFKQADIQVLYLDGVFFEHLIAALKLYKAVMIDKPLGLHLRDVRKPSKIDYRYIWQLFGEELQREALKGVDPYELVRRKALEIYGTNNLDEIGKRIISERVSKLPEYKGVSECFAESSRIRSGICMKRNC
jgi:hypothetical protein